MPWSLFPRPEPDDPKARFVITHTPFHPGFRPHMLASTKTRVTGTAEKRATVRAIKESGGRISEIRKVGWFSW